MIDEFAQKVKELAKEYGINFQEINQALVTIYNPKKKEIKIIEKKEPKKKKLTLVAIDDLKECQS